MVYVILSRFSEGRKVSVSSVYTEKFGPPFDLSVTHFSENFVSLQLTQTPYCGIMAAVGNFHMKAVQDNKCNLEIFVRQ
jgi:hypothetical protein